MTQNPLDNSLSFLQVLSTFNNQTIDLTGKYFNAHLDSSINSADEHIDIEIALHSVTLTNAFYNIHENDRLVFLSTTQDGVSSYVEVLIPPGYYTAADLVLGWPSFPAWNHGSYLGSKPDSFNVSKTVTTLKNGGTNNNNGTIACYLPDTLAIGSTSYRFYFTNSNVNHVNVTLKGLLMQKITLVIPGTILGLPIKWGFLNRLDVSLNSFQALFTATDLGTGNYYAQIQSGTGICPYCANLVAHEFLQLNFLEADMENLNSVEKFQINKTVLIVPIGAPHGVSQTWADPNPIYHSVTDGKLLGMHIDWKDPNGDVVDFNNTQWCANFVYRFVLPNYAYNPLESERRQVAITRQDQKALDPFTPTIHQDTSRLTKLQRLL